MPQDRHCDGVGTRRSVGVFGLDGGDTVRVRPNYEAKLREKTASRRNTVNSAATGADTGDHEPGGVSESPRSKRDSTPDSDSRFVDRGLPRAPEPIIYLEDATLVVTEPPDESDEWEADDILDAVSHETARQILAFARLEPMSAEDLADRCGTSLPTIYRRINALLEYGLLDEQIQITPDGNHYRTFETDVERVSLLIETETFGVEVQFRRDIVDKFGQFWRDLSTSTPDNQYSEDDEQASL